ncbi:retrovirus-related pol polyprotein from transposon TNT 1-94 [Tanacetum coccineum]
MSFVGSSAENATDGSTIIGHGSTMPGSVSRNDDQKGTKHVFSPPLSSRSDIVITRKKVIHNSIDMSKKPSLKPSLKSGIGSSIIAIRTDHGQEFDNEVQFGAYCDAQGITHNFSAPRTPQSNEVVERKNRTLQEMSRTMLNEQSIPQKESLNVTFDESPPPTELSPLVDDDVGEEEAIKINTKVVNNISEEDESIEVDKIVNIEESKNHPLDQIHLKKNLLDRISSISIGSSNVQPSESPYLPVLFIRMSQSRQHDKSESNPLRDLEWLGKVVQRITGSMILVFNVSNQPCDSDSICSDPVSA